MSKALQLDGLGERHPGVTVALGDAYAEAAAVCLSAHHQPPAEITARYKSEAQVCALSWTEPTAATLRAHANEIDATELGAYVFSIVRSYSSP